MLKQKNIVDFRNSLSKEGEPSNCLMYAVKFCGFKQAWSVMVETLINCTRNCFILFKSLYSEKRTMDVSLALSNEGGLCDGP